MEWRGRDWVGLCRAIVGSCNAYDGIALDTWLRHTHTSKCRGLMRRVAILCKMECQQVEWATGVVEWDGKVRKGSVATCIQSITLATAGLRRKVVATASVRAI